MSLSEYKCCQLCARLCRVNRLAGELGFCASGATMRAARAALHFGEEPPISGERGSGAIFFSGCSLSCIFCQNAEISRAPQGVELSVERLSEIMLALQAKGAHNINLVTATHFSPSVRESIVAARARGLSIPIVYNTGSYDTADNIRAYLGLADIYLPDFKYWRSETARTCSAAPSYPRVALAAIDEMVRQHPDPIIENGIMREGVIIRILELPSHVAEAKLTLKSLFERYGNGVFFSLMNQYTPRAGLPKPLDRTLTREEYRELVSYAERIGVVQAFVQEWGTASSAFVPAFDGTGLY